MKKSELSVNTTTIPRNCPSALLVQKTADFIWLYHLISWKLIATI